MKARKQNKEYWQKRMAALEDKQYERSASYYKDVQRQYVRAANSIQMDIMRWYQRLADNNDVSYAGAKKLLRKNGLEEFKWTVEEYIKAGEENAVNRRWMKELENASARHHISYLEAMKLQIQQHAELLSTEFEGGMTNYLHKAYGEQYYRTAFEMAKGTGVGANLAQLDTRKVDAIIKRPWAQDGANFSDRIWTNKDKLVRNLHTELTQNIIRGASPQKAIDSLSKTMEVSRSQAGRLIMTESAAISSAAQKDCLKGLGVEKYEILATLDSRTSQICRDMDGEVFDMKDYKVGETAPPFHPWCRSTTVPYFEDEFTAGEQRAARGEDGKTYYVPADMRYREWEKQFVVEKGTEPDIMKSGAVSGARNPYGNAAKEHAVRYYGLVRSMKTDVPKIAKSTGYSEEQIQEIKNFIFLDKHDLGGPEPEYFMPDYMMAESWRRMIDGKPEPHDLTLLKHEIKERELIGQGYGQDVAHRLTSAEYNYSKEASEYYAKIKKYKKE